MPFACLAADADFSYKNNLGILSRLIKRCCQTRTDYSADRNYPCSLNLRDEKDLYCLLIIDKNRR
jgi:hypothetical protein